MTEQTVENTVEQTQEAVAEQAAEQQIDVTNVGIQLGLSVGSINYILAVLGTKPYEEVAGLIGTIRHQAEVQLQSMDFSQLAAEQAAAAQ